MIKKIPGYVFSFFRPSLSCNRKVMYSFIFKQDDRKPVRQNMRQMTGSDHTCSGYKTGAPYSFTVL
jgi:hypothetical protein